MDFEYIGASVVNLSSIAFFRILDIVVNTIQLCRRQSSLQKIRCISSIVDYPRKLASYLCLNSFRKVNVRNADGFKSNTGSPFMQRIAV